MNTRGDFVIAWIEARGLSREILARRFAPDGNAEIWLQRFRRR